VILSNCDLALKFAWHSVVTAIGHVKFGKCKQNICCAGRHNPAGTGGTGSWRQ